MLANQTCPVVRATYPVPWMWRASNALLGWTTNDANPRGGNCQIVVQDDWLCAALGSGFIIAEASFARGNPARGRFASRRRRGMHRITTQRERGPPPHTHTPKIVLQGRTTATATATANSMPAPAPAPAQVLLPIFIVFLVWPYVLKPVAKLGLELAVKAIEWAGEIVELLAGKIHQWFETR